MKLKRSDTHRDLNGASWPLVASKAQRVEWAIEILRDEISVQLPPVTIDTDYNLRMLALGILHGMEWDRAQEEARATVNGEGK